MRKITPKIFSAEDVQLKFHRALYLAALSLSLTLFPYPLTVFFSLCFLRAQNSSEKSSIEALMLSDVFARVYFIYRMRAMRCQKYDNPYRAGNSAIIAPVTSK